MTVENHRIPESYVQLCREIGALAKKHGLGEIRGTFDDSSFYGPAKKETWNGEIHFSWSQGRHGAESDRIHVQSNMRVCTTIEPEKGDK